MLRLFFLVPKRPCKIRIGAPVALPLLSCRSYERSMALQLALAWNERAHCGRRLWKMGNIRLLFVGYRADAQRDGER
jgi:hypothetical protein